VDNGLTGCNRERPGLREALPGGCHLGRHQAGPVGPVAAGRSGDRGRGHGSAGPAQRRRRRVRPDRPGSAGCCSTCWPWSSRPTSFGCGPTRAWSREGRGSAPGQATQSQPAPRSASGRVAEVGYYSTAEIGDLFGVARSTVYRAIGCEQATSPTIRRRPDPVNCGTSLAMSRYTSPTQRHLDGGPVPRWVTPKRDIATIGCRAPVDLRSGFGYRYG